MKKLLTYFMIAVVTVSSFTACSEETKNEIIPPMTGYWRCTSIGGSVFGVNTPAIENKYLNLFSIGYVGLVGTGYYTRTGSTDLASTASAVTTITSPLNSSSDWSSFMTSGGFTYDATAKTVTHNLKNGETETFIYEISADGNELKLTTQTASPIGGKSLTSAVGALNSILTFMNSSTINTNTGIVYTYQKSTIAEIAGLLNNSAAGN